jgi:hypothetical protein
MHTLAEAVYEACVAWDYFQTFIGKNVLGYGVLVDWHPVLDFPCTDCYIVINHTSRLDANDWRPAT